MDWLREPLPIDEADAVIVGAGAFGYGVGYQLARLGVKRVVVLDQYEPGTQVSPRAAGLFKQLQSSRVKVELARMAIEIVRGFAAESGVSLPYVNSGSILAARTPEHLGMIDAEAEDGRGWGVEVRMIDGAEAERIAPFLEGSTLRAAYHIPGDIYIEEPKSLLVAYRQAGERLGMQVYGHTRVTGVPVRAGEVTGVETTRGPIRSPVVVDAAGVWARELGRMAGVDVPVQPVRHQLRITAPIAGVAPEMPIVRIVDASAYVRPARGGLMVGGMEQGAVAIAGAGPGFMLDQVPLDMAVTERFAADLAPSVPDVRTTTSQEERGGLFTMTADGRLMAGPSNAVRGFWVATGCNGSGFSLSVAVGRCLAEWIVGGASPLDLSLLDPNRFNDRPLTDDQLEAAALFQYSNYYTPSLR